MNRLIPVIYKDYIFCGILILFFLLFSNSINAQVPVISSFSPVSGTVGTSVTITGNNFSSVAANNIVYFGGVKATVSSATNTSLIVTVPSGATYHSITVTTNNLTAYSPKFFSTTFSGTGNIDGGAFASIGDSTVGLHPNGIVVGDFDNDGKIDIATPNSASNLNTISILKNTSTIPNISFAADEEFTTGISPYSIATGDLDGDGKLDIVTANINDGNVNGTFSALRNTSTPGNISFAANVDFLTGTSPQSIAIGDLNGDGKPDVVVTNFISGTVSVFKNTSTVGNISFAPKVDYTTALGAEHVAGDIDGDGKPDMIVTDFLSKAISVYVNTSTGGIISFAAKNDFLVGGDNPFDVAISDLDGDGKADVIITNDNYTSTIPASISVSILHNSSTAGSISFSNQVNYSTGNSYNISIGDMNGDGRPDIAVPNFSDNISVYANNSILGGIILKSPVVYSSYSSYSIGIADLDGDGKADMAVADFTYTDVSLFKNRVNEPNIHSFTPVNAVVGDTIIISGTNFTSVTGVNIGGIPAISFNIINSNEIQAIVGAASSGNISITSPTGPVIDTGFLYGPTMSSFVPYEGGQGTVVTITGTDFRGVTAVTFGGTPAQSFTVVNPTTINAIVGTGSTGSLTVSTVNGNVTLNGFLFIPPPTITSFTPSAGNTGSQISITGTHFSDDGTKPIVTFGGVPAQYVYVYSTNFLIVVVDTGASGNIKITTAAGSVTINGFTYIPPPIITSFNPAAATLKDTVTISGINFTGTTAVTFGDSSVVSFNVVSDTIIKAVLWLGESGKIKITRPSGTGTINGFTYINPPPPSISSVSSLTGTPGSAIKIFGTHFFGTKAVMFGGVNANSFTIISDGEIDAVVGFGSSGNISVTTLFGSGSIGGFAIIQPPVINSFAPLNGPIGTTVTINGANFGSTTANNIVYFGGVRAVVTAATTTQLTVKVPLGTNYQPITVTTNTKLTAYSSNAFNVTAAGAIPTINDSSFTVRSDFATDGYYTGNIAIADLDGDGRPDMVNSMGNSGTSISVFLNSSSPGNAVFYGYISLPTEYYPEAVAIGDLNGDGKPDIAAANSGSNSISILRNTSTTNSFSFANAINVQTGGNTNPDNVIIGDVNGDGKPDVISVNPTNNSISIFGNISVGNSIAFATPIVYSLGNIELSGGIAIGDIDGDGKPDIVVMSVLNNVIIFRNTGINGAFSFIQAPAFDVVSADEYTSEETCVEIGDLDGDGKPDLIIGKDYEYAFSVLRNTSTPGNLSFATYQNINPGGDDFTRYISIEDIDGDGKPDLTSTLPNDVAVVYRNTSTAGNISFTTGFQYATSASPISATAADLDLDGKPDIVTNNNAINMSSSVLLNTAKKIVVENVCSAVNNLVFTADIIGTSYEWQVNTGSGFTDIADDNNYSGANSISLQLTNMSYSNNGYQYQCIVNGGSDIVYTIQFLNFASNTAGNDTSICLGSSVSIGAPMINGNTYSWSSSPVGFVSSIANPDVSPIANTSYYLTITDSSCIFTDTVAVSVNKVQIILPDTVKTICSGAFTELADSNNIGFAYSWTSYPVGFLSTSQDPVVSPSVNTSYYLTVTDSLTGCSASGKVDVILSGSCDANNILYPNPSNDYITIQLDPGITLPLHLKVTNSSGATVINEELNNITTTISVIDFPAGVYFYNIKNESGKKIKSGELIIIH